MGRHDTTWEGFPKSCRKYHNTENVVDVLQNTLIEAAGCILPLTESQMILPEMGTRHRAALGITEESDAIVVVVSEERGTISTAENGRFTNLDIDEMKLRRYLNERLFISSGD